MAAIDFSKFNFSGEQIQSTKELLWDELVHNHKISELYNIYSGVKTKKEVGFIGAGGLVGLPDKGCAMDAQGFQIGTRTITFDPQGWKVFIQECYKAFDNTFVAYQRKAGKDMSDMQDSDYVNIVVDVLLLAIEDFITRVMWMGDKDAKNVADGGVVTDGVNVEAFTLFDGFFKQMAVQGTKNAKQIVAIAENKTNADLEPAKAQEYLSKVYYGAPVTLHQTPNLKLYVTHTVYMAYEQSLSGTQLETMYANLVDGQKRLTYRGIELIDMAKWDELLLAYQAKGGKAINPHRIVFTSADLLGMAVDGENSFSEVDTFFDKRTEEVGLRAMGMLDAKLLDPARFVLAI